MDNETIDVRSDSEAATDVVARLEARVYELEDEVAHLNLQLAILSSTDAVTGLANRTGMADSIEMALYRLQRMAEPFAVVGVRFPGLNELGHDRVEAVRDLGALIAASLRNVDRVGRLDDSTFAVVLANVPADHVATVTDRTRSLIGSLPASAGVDVEIDATLVALSVTDNGSAHQVVEVLDELESMLDAGGPGVAVL